MLVSDIMTRGVEVVHPDDTLENAADRAAVRLAGGLRTIACWECSPIATSRCGPSPGASGDVLVGDVADARRYLLLRPTKTFPRRRSS